MSNQPISNITHLRANNPVRLSALDAAVRMNTDGSLRQEIGVNSYRSEEVRHIDVYPRTRSLSTPLCHLPGFAGDILASLLDRRGRLLCHIAQITSGNSHPLHRLLRRFFHLTGCL